MVVAIDDVVGVLFVCCFLDLHAADYLLVPSGQSGGAGRRSPSYRLRLASDRAQRAGHHSNARAARAGQGLQHRAPPATPLLPGLPRGLVRSLRRLLPGVRRPVRTNILRPVAERLV